MKKKKNIRFERPPMTGRGHLQGKWDLTDSFGEIETTCNEALQSGYIQKPTATAWIVGPLSVGKTCLLHRLIYDSFPRFSSCTVGFDFRELNLQYKNEKAWDLDFRIYDISGDVSHLEFAKRQIKEPPDAIIYCFGLDSEYVLEDEAFEFDYINDPLRFLIGCKSDLPNLDIDERIIRYSRDEMKCEYFRTSSLRDDGEGDGTKVVDVFTRIGYLLLERRLRQLCDEFNTKRNEIRIQRINVRNMYQERLDRIKEIARLPRTILERVLNNFCSCS